MATPHSPASNTPQLAELVQRHQAMVAVQRNGFTLRMHRSLSWLQRAAAEKADDDIAFVCLWIAFNAAYAQDNGGHTENASERQTFRSFVAEICRLDADKALPTLVSAGVSGADSDTVGQPIFVPAVLGSAQQPAPRWHHAHTLARRL